MEEVSLCPHIVLNPVRTGACRRLPRYRFGACSALLVQGHAVMWEGRRGSHSSPLGGALGSKDHVCFGALEGVWGYDEKRWVPRTFEAERQE